MDEQPDPEDLVDLRKAARIVGTHISTIYRWIQDGRLRCWRLVGRRRVSRVELLDLLRPVEVRRRPADLAPRAPTKAQDLAAARRVLRGAGFGV